MNAKYLIITGACLSLIFYSGCAGEDEPATIDCSKSDLAIAFNSVNPESCVVVNGSITGEATGGKAPYTYALNASTFGSNAVFSGLSAGDYILRVKDKNGCTVQSSVIELRIPGNDLNVTIDTEPDTECLSDTGSITVTGTGGTPPYQYTIANGVFGDNPTFTLLPTGNHTVTVKDAAGCLFPKAVFVDREDTGTSLDAEIMPIIQANCAINNCHNGSQEPNFTNPQNVRSHASKIKDLTQRGIMPKEGSLSPSEKALIACWVDDGAKDN